MGVLILKTLSHARIIPVNTTYQTEFNIVTTAKIQLERNFRLTPVYRYS